MIEALEGVPAGSDIQLLQPNPSWDQLRLPSTGLQSSTVGSTGRALGKRSSILYPTRRSTGRKTR